MSSTPYKRKFAATPLYHDNLDNKNNNTSCAGNDCFSFGPTTASATFMSELPADVLPMNCLWGTLWNPEIQRLCEGNNIAPFNTSSLAIPSPLQTLREGLLNATASDVTATHSNEQYNNDVNVIDQRHHLGLTERIIDRVHDIAQALADLT
jgi:hypothetical protein